VAQDFGATTGPVYTQILQRSVSKSTLQLDTWQATQDVIQEKCNTLNFTIFSKNETFDSVLVLTATKEEIKQFFINADFTEDEEKIIQRFYKTFSGLDPILYANNPVYINVSILPCPSGFTLRKERPFRCDCNDLLQSLNGVSCHIQDQTIGRSGLVWIGTLKDENESVVTSEYCAYGYCNNGETNVTLSEPDSQCNYNHSWQTLCTP